MANISENELLQVVNDKQVDAINNRSRIEEQNEFLNDRYNGEYYGTEVAGRSRYVSNDVKDAVEDAHTSLVRMFLGAGPIVKFSANNPNDQRQVAEAMEKTQLVDWIVRGQTNSYQTQSSFLTNALKLKAGVLKYYYEETEATEDHEWEGLTAQEVEDQLDALGFELSDVDEDGQELDIATILSKSKNKQGEIVSHTVNGPDSFDIKVRVTVKRQQIKVDNVHTSSFMYSTGADCLEDADLVGDEFFKTRGELLSEGYSRELVDSLPSSSINGETYRTTNETLIGNISESDFNEWASQKVPISDLYVLVDYNNDGIAERRRIQKSGDIIIFNEPYNHVPYCSASSIIVPHEVTGEGWGEQVTDIAEVNTAITRGTLDNIYAVNNTKKIFRVGKDGVNLDEAMSQKIGGIVQARGERPLADIYQPIITEFVGDKALLIKQHMDQMKSNRIGGQLASQGLDGDTLSKETATRFTGIEKSSQAKVEKVARNIAEVGYRKLYEGIAWTLAHHEMDEIEFAVLNKALKANPSNWKYDSNLETEIGLGAGDNEQVVNNAQGMWAIHSQLKAEGSTLTDEKKGYNILAKMYRATDVKDLSLYINDPEEPAEQLRVDNEKLNATAMQQQQMIEQLAEQVKQLQALSEVEMIKAQSKAEADNKKAALELAKLEEDKRQFNIKTAQDEQQHDEETAVELTKIEASSRT